MKARVTLTNGVIFEIGPFDDADKLDAKLQESLDSATENGYGVRNLEYRY